jgi:Caspase domain
MRLRCGHRPHFSKKGLGFLFGIALAATFLLWPMKDANSSVIKMPKPLPDIVKTYKSVKIWAGSSGMNHTGLKVHRGDYITILAKGTINVWPAKGKEYAYGPKALLVFILGDNDHPVRRYKGPELMEVKEDGGIYLGYRGSEISPSGRPLKPLHFNDDVGSFYVDIIVWKTNDAGLMSRFLDEASSAQPKDGDLKEIAQEFRWRSWGYLAHQEKTKEVEEIRKELSIAETKEISETKKEEKKTVLPPKEKEVPRIKDSDKAKATEDLNERLQKALQALKELEDTKKKLSEREEKEAQLLARLESMERERSIQSKSLPVIAVAYPKDGISVDSENVSLYGVAEHENGISKLEIFVNNKPVGQRGHKDLQLPPKDRKRIEFSERIHLREGQNTVSIAVQGTEGLTSQKTIFIRLAKKQEKVYAVVIGIDKYKNLPPLKYAAHDAREFYRYLTEVNQVPKDHVWLLLDEEATLEKLRRTLGTLLRRSAGKEDTVIIFLAGHGATETDPSSPDGDGLEKYILPINADPMDLYSSAMPMSEVARIFQRISSERLVFIGDTCYSGASGGRTIFAGGTRATVSSTFLERLSQGKGRVILTASDANEVSVERDDLGHGVFTYYLLEGLRGKADVDGDGVITVDEIYRYVSEKVPQATGQDQHPVRKGEITGQIVLGVVR